MGRAVKVIHRSHIPEDEIKALVKRLLPDKLEYFESKGGKNLNSEERTICKR